jgi:large subunit ribosomal protein L22
MTTVEKRLTRKEKIAQGLPKLAGNRKKRSAEARREQTRQLVKVELNGYPSSARKMRLVADQVRGLKLDHALNILLLSPKSAARPLRKLLVAAKESWDAHQPEARFELDELFVETIFVDSAAMMKRIRPAPQGRAYRVRKRSHHVTVTINALNPAALEEGIIA